MNLVFDLLYTMCLLKYIFINVKNSCISNKSAFSETMSCWLYMPLTLLVYCTFLLSTDTKLCTAKRQDMWTTVVMKEQTTFDHIPALQADILNARLDNPFKKCRPAKLGANDPSHIQPNFAKKSRYQ